MNLTQHMPTFARWYRTVTRRLAGIPRMPYIIFLGGSIIATAIVPFVFNWMLNIHGSSLSVFIMIATPICLPVVLGDLMLLFYCRKQHSVFRPSVLLRIVLLALVMEGFFLIFRYRNPQEIPGYASTEELIFVNLYVAQCVLLLIMEPGLRSLIRGKRIIRPVVDPGDYTRPF